MKIGIIGSGIVAQVMGRAFLTEGEEIMMGSRDPQKDSIKKWKAENPGANAGSFAEDRFFRRITGFSSCGTCRFAGA
ncbi:MAG: NAD(P)-binding domain-containing protein [Puia sp.]